MTWRQQSPQSLEQEVAGAPRGAGQPQALHHPARTAHPCLHSRPVTPRAPFSFWSRMPGSAHGQVSLEGSRMLLETDAAEPAGPKAIQPSGCPGTMNRTIHRPWLGWCHRYSPHMGLGGSRPNGALAMWAKGGLYIWSYAEGSRAALPDINMFGTALKKRSKWNRRPK